MLTQIKIFTTQLDENRGDIVNAIESLNRLAISARQQQGSIDSALENLPSALTSLDRQTDDLVKMLQALNRLGCRRHAGHPGIEGEHHRVLPPAAARAHRAGQLR